MAFCANCGNQLSDTDRACTNCGQLVGAKTQARPAAMPMAARRTEGTAIAALVLGIAGFVVCPIICSILAIVFGNQAKEKIRLDPSLEGEGMAKAGVIMGWIGIAFGVLGLLFWFFAMAMFASTSSF